MKLSDIIEIYGNQDGLYICHGNDENDILIVNENGEVEQRFNLNNGA